MFHVKLQFLRKKANMSRKQLATKLNVTYPTIAKYETSQSEPDFNTLRKIATIFNVSIDFLLDVPPNYEQMINEISIYFDVVKDISKNSKDQVYFNSQPLSDTSKAFIYDSIDYITAQVLNINNDKQ